MSGETDAQLLELLGGAPDDDGALTPAERARYLAQLTALSVERLAAEPARLEAAAQRTKRAAKRLRGGQTRD